MKHPLGVTIILPIHIFNHNQYTLHEKVYYVATSFNPERGPRSGHDNKNMKV
jgi:hypothetical protein